MSTDKTSSLFEISHFIICSSLFIDSDIGIWNALNPSNRKKFEKLSIKKMANVAWKLVK